MTHANMRLYEPGPIMKRMAQERGAERLNQLIEMIEEPDVHKGIPSFESTYIIGSMPLEFQVLRRHHAKGSRKVIDLIATAEFPHAGKLAYAIEMLSVSQTAEHDLIRTTIEIALAGRMAEIHVQMSLGRPFGDIVECRGFLSVLQNRIVRSIIHEESGQNRMLRMRFKLDDDARAQRVAHAHYPEIMLNRISA